MVTGYTCKLVVVCMMRRFVFGSRDRIQTLCQRGKLTLLDSTHRTNKLGWFLFTLVVRDEQGSFIPCAHFLSSNEDGDIIGASLRVIREWTGGLEGWKLAYILTDDSAAEQRGVRLAFDDVESQVRHLLCTKHSGATLDRNLAGNSKKEARQHMKDAMYVRRTAAAYSPRCCGLSTKGYRFLALTKGQGLPTQ